MNCALYFSMVFTTVKDHLLLLKTTVTQHFYYVNVTAKQLACSYLRIWIMHSTNQKIIHRAMDWWTESANTNQFIWHSQTWMLLRCTGNNTRRVANNTLSFQSSLSFFPGTWSFCWKIFLQKWLDLLTSLVYLPKFRHLSNFKYVRIPKFRYPCLYGLQFELIFAISA